MKTGKAAGWATCHNSFGVSVALLCQSESASSGEFERRQRRFLPPGSTAHALVGSGTGYTHVVTLWWDRVVLHEELARQSRVRLRQSKSLSETGTADWDGRWAVTGRVRGI